MCDMKLFPGVLSLLICLFSCASVQAQSTGRVECARDDSYVCLSLRQLLLGSHDPR
jgi:drug/metabolite transporter superfamily protein YnfA